MYSLRLSVTFALTILLAACGGASQSMMPPPAHIFAPVFTSTPTSSASEGSAYNYSITATDPGGGSVSFSLSGPQGSTLNGSTVSWTPSGAQSRVSNGFTVVGTTSEGGTATQSWNVTPAGTIHLSRVNTWWTTTGPVSTVPPLPPPQALVPEADGTFLTIPGVSNGNGIFSIPNVPGGYYWLNAGVSYWTSSGTVDLGSDIVGRPMGTTQSPEQTAFAFSISGLDPVTSGDLFVFLPDWAVLASATNVGFPIGSPSGSTSMTANYTVNSNVDYSTAGTGYLMQYEPFSAGPITGLALGPEATVTLALKSGTTNNVTATLNPAAHVPFDLSVKGSQWAPMFQNAGPGSVTPTDAEITISAQPVGEPLAPTTVRQTLNLPLLLSLPMGTLDGFLAGLPTARCSDSITIGTGSPVTSSSAILTDQDFGTITYGDPFPLGLYSNLFSFCQAASAEVPVPGGGSPATFSFADGVNTQVPDQPVTPVALPVQNPTINGVSFFTANSFSPTGLTISWSQPGGTSPYAYKVGVVKWTNAPGGGLGYAGVSTYYTGKTSVTLPPLESGQTYVFVLTTEVDSRANVETQPLRTGLPTAFATVISAPITTN